MTFVGGPDTVVDIPDGATLFEAGAKVSAGIDTSCVAMLLRPG